MWRCPLETSRLLWLSTNRKGGSDQEYMKLLLFHSWSSLKYLWILMRRCSKKDSVPLWLPWNFSFTQKTLQHPLPASAVLFLVASGHTTSPTMSVSQGLSGLLFRKPSAMCSGNWGHILPGLHFDRVPWKQLSGCVRSVAGDDYFKGFYSYLAWTKLSLTRSGSLALGRSLSRGKLVFWKQEFCKNQK